MEESGKHLPPDIIISCTRGEISETQTDDHDATANIQKKDLVVDHDAASEPPSVKIGEEAGFEEKQNEVYTSLLPNVQNEDYDALLPHAVLKGQQTSDQVKEALGKILNSASCEMSWRDCRYGTVQDEDWKQIIDYMKQFAADPELQQLGCTVCCCLMQSSGMTGLLQQDLFSHVLEMLKTHKSDPGLHVQLSLLHLLASFLEDIQWQEQLVAASDHKLIMDTVRECEASPAVVTKGLCLISMVMSHTPCKTALVKDRMPLFVIELLHKHCQDEGIAQTSLEILHNLLLQSDAHSLRDLCESFVEAELPSSLLEALTAESCTSESVHSAVQLYFILVSWCSDSRLQTSLALTQWLKLTHELMSTYVDNLQIQMVCNRLIKVLLDRYPEEVEHIGDSVSQVSLHTASLGTALMHVKDPAVLHGSFVALQCMAEKSGAVQEALLERNTHIALIIGMKEHSTETAVLETGCKLLRTLATNCLERKLTLLGEDVLGVVKSSLNRFPECLSVVMEATLLLGCLAELDQVKDWCHEQDMHQPILSLLWSHQQVLDLQLVVLETLAVLAGSKDYADKLNDLGALHDFVDIMNNWEDEHGIQLVGLVLVQLLGNQVKRYEKKLGQYMLKVIQAAMLKFKDSVAVQSEACVALHFLCEQELYISQLLVTNNIQTTLFAVLVNPARSTAMRQAQCLASQVLYTLACEANLKDMMLLLACSQGQTKDAECLLELGADVNYGSGLDTPLCHACKARNHSLVQLLLNRGVTELQTALMLCLDMKSHELVGMLLKLIGIDPADGSISWGGLGLSDLHPEWLAPTFLPDTPCLQTDSELGCGRSLAKQILQTHQRLEEAREEQEQRDLLESYSLVMTASDSSGQMSVQVDSVLEDTYPPARLDEQRDAVIDIDRHVAPWRHSTLVGSPLPYQSEDTRLVRANVLDDTDIVEPAGNSWGRDQPPTPQSDTCLLTSKAAVSEKNDQPVSEGPPSGQWELDSLLQKPNSDASEHPMMHLDLSNNEMTDLSKLIGPETSDLLSTLGQLTKLDLSNNQLMSIPEELFTHLTGLEHLDFSNNSLHCFPVLISNCPKLTVLNASRNKLVDFNLGEETPLVCLRELDLSNNWLQLLPLWVATNMPHLHMLNIAGNALECLPNTALDLPDLLTLNLSFNDIESLPESFLANCLKLETLNMAGNQLTEGDLPESEELISKLTKLTTTNLSNNQLSRQAPFYLPKFVLQLPSLKYLNMESNQLTGLARPELWSSPCLRSLVMSHNSIQELNLEEAEGKHWSSSLEKLDLSHNRLQKLPADIGQLKWLTSLNISHNPSLTSLPDELGRLDRLWELNLDGLKLDLDPGLLKQRTKDIVGYLHQKLKKSVSYYHMKLMVVGFGGRGKTSLLQCLRKQRNPQHSLPTVGIVIRPWKFVERRGTKFVTYNLSTWDFAGQEEFHSTHQCFLSNRAVYLVVYNLQYGTREIDVLKPWLLNIKARAPHCPVIVIGTHLDLVPTADLDDMISTMRTKITELCEKPGYPEIRGMAEVCCTRETSKLERLRVVIKQVLDSFKIQNQPMMGQKVPASYVELQETLSEELRRLKEAEKAPIIDQPRLNEIVQQSALNLQGEELKQAVRFLHDCGNLLHYEDTRLKLSHLFFLDPEWLCRMMSQVVTVRQINPFVRQNGVLHRNALMQLFSGKKVGEGESSAHVFPPHLIPQYIALLEKFEIALPLSDSEMLLACKLPAARPRFGVPSRQDQVWIQRHYKMQYVPVGFWSRLLTRILAFLPHMSEEVDADAEEEPNLHYWREGIFASYNEQAFFLVESSYKGMESVDIAVPPSRLGARFLGQLVDHLDALIEEWFPGLLQETVTGDQLLQKLVPCIKCKGDKVHNFTLETLVAAAETADEISCPNHPEMVLLASLAPDVVLADLEPMYRLRRSNLDFSESPDNLLGDGGFGKVYKGTYWKQAVAVKVFSGGVDVHPHKLMRREVTVLEKLRHPSLVSLVGVTLKPRAIVLELAPLGSLSAMLKAERNFCRQLQHRMALQIADGLRYLHKRQIVYRDLKPANILVFSLSLAMVVNVKISDYGSSRLSEPLGLVSTEGTVGYRAPEVIRGQAYSFEADVFSLGMTLYELITGGMRPFHVAEYQTELEEAILRGEPLQPISCRGHDPWPDMEDVIGQCMQQAPDNRLSCESVYIQLCKADVLTLRRLVPISNDHSPEAATFLQTPEGNAEIWIASSSRDSVHLSWLVLGSSSQRELQGSFVNDSYILSMLAIRSDHVILGSQSGKVWVCNARSHDIPRGPSLVLADSVLSLLHFSNSEIDCILIGLANGQVVIYSTSSLLESETVLPPQIVQLGTPLEPVKCLCVGSVSRGRVIAGVGCGIQAIKLGPKPKKDSIVAWDTHTKGLKLLVSLAKDARITSAKQVGVKGQLWVGVATGHMILIDSEKYQPLTSIHRHLEAVRCLAVTTLGGNYPSTCVLSAGRGFKTLAQEDRDCSYAAVWSSDVTVQAKRVQNHIQRRQSWSWQQSSAFIT